MEDDRSTGRGVMHSKGRDTRGAGHVLQRYCAIAAMRLRRVSVVALVGKSGSGKSFRARLIAEKRNIPLIIDDGLVISSGTILTGHWAKKERSLVGSVRRALFADEAHAREARDVFRSVSFRALLITATSPRMAIRIAANLWLPAPTEIIHIEDVATRREIRAALHRRRAGNAHASPIPEIRVRRGLLSALRSIARPAKRRVDGSARIVAPSSDAGGAVAFSEEALAQLSLHCVREFEPRIDVRRVTVQEDAGMAVLELSLRVPGDLGGSGRLHDLRDAIMHGMERGAGIIIRDVRLVVDEIALS
jgi:hypothetical protein